ncbi:amino acid adenylation domain-containing protein [Bacillus paralicheniformis]|uniref:amino acid adenylation domain-containing protein n=1 Tax=Bacillus paralicheniformis TaxID=1648923 RepID=UPI000D03E959|nr:amino acid adenylation domain-containing protein [Bacillus paralicheniformis]
MNELVCLHTLFERQVEKQATAAALSFEGKQMSYGELNERANQLAHYLQRLGAGPDTLIGLCAEPSFEMIVGIMAILKSGAAYVPLNPRFPEQHLELIIHDSKIHIMLSDEKNYDRMQKFEADTILSLNPLHGGWSEESKLNPVSKVNAHNLAYVIYTSGSTGKPKGVLIEHHNVVRLLSATQHWYQFDNQDVWTLYHSFSFDISVWEMWGALLYGGRLVIVPYLVTRDFEQFYRLLAEEKVTILNQTPTAFKSLIMAEEVCGGPAELSLRFVIFGGEPLLPQNLRPWFERHGDEQPQLINMYGITETTVHVTYRPMTWSDLNGNSSLIGIPIPDLQLYLLDQDMKPVPTGTPGEIYVGGPGVGRGYLNRPELTRERFLPDQFSSKEGDKLYKSGDLAIRLASGEIQFLERVDLQVKVRGFRIELQGIENALLGHPCVKEAVVQVQDKDSDFPKIVAYIIYNQTMHPDAKDIRQYLRDRIPEYMVPNVIVPIKRLPITENGKLNRKKLPWPVKDIKD